MRSPGRGALLVALATLLALGRACPGLAQDASALRRHVTPELDAYWRWLSPLIHSHPDRDLRLAAWCRGRLATPYVRDCQGEGQGQDPDPLFTPGRVDCTVLVLQAAASLDAQGPEDLVRRMLLANYRRWNPDATVAYRDRYHYTVDRLLSSPLFRDITREVFPKESLQRVSLVLNRKADGSPTVPLDWSRPVDVAYRPTSDLEPADLTRLPKGCGIVFVRRANFALGFIAAHEGILIDRRLLFHASSVGGRVVVERFVPYARRRDGIMVFEFVKRP